MNGRDSYSHGFRLDQPIRLATDSLMNQVTNPEYSPTPPPVIGYFVLLNGGNFLLLNGQDLTLL